MLGMLCPSQFKNSVLDVDLEDLRGRGIRAIIIDLDNTLVRWDHQSAPDKLLQWVRSLAEKGFRACIVSNNGAERVGAFADAAGIPGIPNASKPRRKSFRLALKVMGARETETAVIGDQLFTDILGGNRMGMFTILVPPICRRELPTTRIMRGLERVLIGIFERQGLLSRPKT